MTAPAAYIEHLLSSAFDGTLAPGHLADLRRRGFSDETIQLKKIRSVPPSMIDRLLGFSAPEVVSAYIIPFTASPGGRLDYVHVKIFSAGATGRGSIKYLRCEAEAR